MKEMIEFLFKLLVLTMVISITIILTPVVYAVGILGWMVYSYNGNAWECIDVTNTIILDSYFKPIIKSIKDIWGA